MGLPDWYYDDLRHVGLDFSSEEEVGTYDARQQGAAEKEAARLRDLGLESGHVLADIGCGTGILACEAAKMCSFVHAVDISRPMLRAAETCATALGLSNMAFHNAGFLSVEMDDGALDLVTSQFALHHLPDFWKAAALVRMRRMLRPGGRVFLRDVVFTCDPDEIPDAVERWIAWMRENSGYEREEVAGHVREEHSTFAWVMEGLIERAGLRLLSASYENEVYGTYVAERPAGS
jgi:ubiquinone/menaquinone biosynthesis C-methylase UbiE